MAERLPTPKELAERITFLCSLKPRDLLRRDEIGEELLYWEPVHAAIRSRLPKLERRRRITEAIREAWINERAEALVNPIGDAVAADGDSKLKETWDQAIELATIAWDDPAEEKQARSKSHGDRRKGRLNESEFLHLWWRTR